MSEARNLEEMGINLQKIITRLQKNQNLLKLLYYTDKDPLSQPDLTDEQIKKIVVRTQNGTLLSLKKRKF